MRKKFENRAYGFGICMRGQGCVNEVKIETETLTDRALFLPFLRRGAGFWHHVPGRNEQEVPPSVKMELSTEFCQRNP